MQGLLIVLVAWHHHIKQYLGHIQALSSFWEEHPEATITRVTSRQCRMHISNFIWSQRRLGWHNTQIKKQMNNQESAATFERIIKELQPMKERNRTNQQREQNKVRAVHSCVSLQTQIFCNKLTKHRWMAFSVDLMRLFLQCIYFLTVSEKTFSSHFIPLQHISKQGT